MQKVTRHPPLIAFRSTEAGPRLRECCRQRHAKVISNSRNKIHKTWERKFSPPLFCQAKWPAHSQQIGPDGTCVTNLKSINFARPCVLNPHLGAPVHAPVGRACRSPSVDGHGVEEGDRDAVGWKWDSLLNDLRAGRACLVTDVVPFGFISTSFLQVFELSQTGYLDIFFHIIFWELPLNCLLICWYFTIIGKFIWESFS